MSLLVESGPGPAALTCEETRFGETPTSRGLTQSGLCCRNAPPIGPTSEAMTCEVSFSLVRHARIDKIQ